MAEFQVPNPTMSLATQNTLGDITSIAPVNFYNPLPVKDYTSGVVNPIPVKDPIEKQIEDITSNILGNQLKEINKDKGLTNKLTNPSQVPYEETKRYQDSELGYTTSPNLEFMYGEKQGLTGAIGNSLIQSAGNFVSSFLGSFTNTYSIGAAIKNEDLDSLFDNDLVNAANTFSEIGQDWGTIYDTRQMRDNPLLSRKLLTSTISSLGYLGAFAGSAVQDIAISAALGPEAGIGLAGVQLANAYKKISQFVKVFSNGEEGVEALRKSLLVTKSLGNAVDQAATSVPFREGFRKINQYTAGMFEASIEAKEAVTKVEDKLKDEYFRQNGYQASGDELKVIKDRANEAGNWTYFANAALLTTTNHFEFGELFERWRVGKRSFDTKQGGLDLGLDGYNKIINNTPARQAIKEGASYLEKAKDLVVRAGRNTPSAFTMATGEFIEEMGQGIISGASEDYYTNFINPHSGLESILKATGEQFGTQEGWLSGISGILTGAAMSGILAGAGVNPMDKTPDALYANAVVEELNNNSIGTFLREKIRVNQIQQTRENANNGFIKSNYEKQAEDHTATFNHWITGLKHKQYDLRQQQLDEAKNLQGKDFTEEWGMEYNEENKAVIDRFIDEQKAKGKHIKEVFDTIDKTFINPFDRRSRIGRSEDNSESYALYDAVKDELVFQVSKFDNNEDYINSLVNKATTNLKVLQNGNDILDLGSLYGEEIEEGFSSKDGNIFKKYTIKNKTPNSNQGLSKIKKDLDKEIKDIESLLNSDLVVGEDRSKYNKDFARKTLLSLQINDLLENGLTEVFTDKEGRSGIKHTEDYLVFLSQYLNSKRNEAGITEPLSAKQLTDFYTSVRSINDATLSNNRTAKIINDLLSPNAIKNFKAQGKKIQEIRTKLQQEKELVAEEELQSTTTPEVKTEQQNVETEKTNEQEQNTDPQQGDQFKGEILTQDEEGNEISLKGDFEIVDRDNIDDTITVKQNGKETVIPIEDFNNSPVTKVDEAEKVQTKVKAESPSEKIVNVPITSEQLEDNLEASNKIEEVAVPEDIIIIDIENNTFEIENEKGQPETFKTLTSALGQKYSDDIDSIYKNIAIQSSIVLHALFKKSETTYGEIAQSIPDINEDRFNNIVDGYKDYNQWLINNNKEIVKSDFYIKDYNENDNNALVHIDLLIYDVKNSLYQIVDFKTRSLYSNQKDINGVKGNNPDQWDKEQILYKRNLVQKTLSTSDIKNKNFSTIDYIFKFLTTYTKDQNDQKVLETITHEDKPITISNGLEGKVSNSKELKIDGHTIDSLKKLSRKDFQDIMKQNRITTRKLTSPNIGLIHMWEKVRTRSIEDLKEYNNNNKDKNQKKDNEAFWVWQRENFEMFSFKDEVKSLDEIAFNKEFDNFIKTLNSEVKKNDIFFEMAYPISDKGSYNIIGSYNEVEQVFEYSTDTDQQLSENELRDIIRNRKMALGQTKEEKIYVLKDELLVKTNFTKKFKIFVNGRKVKDDRTRQQIIDDYGTNNLRDIIKGISEKSLYSPEKELALSIADKIPRRFNIEFIETNTKDVRIDSYYDPATEKLVINIDRLKELGYSIDGAILHEAIHVLTAQRLKTSTKFIQDIRELSNIASTFINTPEGKVTLNNIYGTSNAEIYGLTGNLDEFIAEALTSPDFQNLLRAIDAKDIVTEKKSIWPKLVDYIRQALGIQVEGFEDTLLAKTVYRIGKEFDTLSVDKIGNSLNLDFIFGKTILKIESNDEYKDTNEFGNKILREQSLDDIIKNSIVHKENGVEPKFKKFQNFDYIYNSKFPYNLVLKYPNAEGGMETFTSMGLVDGFRFKRPNNDELFTLDHLADNDISDSEFELITKVDRSLRSEFINKLNSYINFQSELANKADDTNLSDLPVEININNGTLKTVPYENRTNVNELKPMMFRGSDGISPAPLILERNYTWELGGGKVREVDSGFSSIYNDPIFENELSSVMDYLRENIGQINSKLKSTYVLIVPKGGIQTTKKENFTDKDFDFIPVYPDNYDINDNTYLNHLKFMSNYISKNLPVEMYEESLIAEQGIKNVYIAAPEKYQFQNESEDTMSANAAEISISDGNGNSNVKGYLNYKFKASNEKDNLSVSISPERVAKLNSMQELIDALNEELELKIKGSNTSVSSDFKITPYSFKKSLPKTEGEGRDRFLRAIEEGQLTTPLHKNIRNLSLNIVPKEIIKSSFTPKPEEVIFTEPVIKAQEEAREINNEQQELEITQEDIDRANQKKTVKGRRRFGDPGMFNEDIEDMIRVCG